MKVNTDTFFRIGSSHDVCQDYALHNQFAAIVSDGCSSSPDTDFGARLLVKAKEMHFYADNKEVYVHALRAAEVIGLHNESLNATLLSVDYDPVARMFQAEISGDGVVVARRIRHENCLDEKGYSLPIPYADVVSVEFKSGAPYYLRYQTSERMKENYIKEFGQTFQVRTFEWETGVAKSHISPDAYVCGYGLDKSPYRLAFNSDYYDLVAVMTDGAHSFVQKVESGTSITTKPIPVQEILPELFGFKNYNGAFVKRRCAKALKDLAAKGITHYDDFSMGVVHLGAEE